jgi:hypothetical protein
MKKEKGGGIAVTIPCRRQLILTHFTSDGCRIAGLTEVVNLW